MPEMPGTPQPEQTMPVPWDPAKLYTDLHTVHFSEEYGHALSGLDELRRAGYGLFGSAIGVLSLGVSELIAADDMPQLAEGFQIGGIGVGVLGGVVAGVGYVKSRRHAARQLGARDAARTAAIERMNRDGNSTSDSE